MTEELGQRYHSRRRALIADRTSGVARSQRRRLSTADCSAYGAASTVNVLDSGNGIDNGDDSDATLAVHTRTDITACGSQSGGLVQFETSVDGTFFGMSSTLVSDCFRSAGSVL